MILTVTLNPALDKSTEMEKLVPEKKMRCDAVRVEAGGGGINIAKAIRELGGDCLALFPSGGINGKLLEHKLKASSIPFHAFPIEGETRESFVARDKSNNKQYRFVMPGPALDANARETILGFISKMEPVPGFLICSGSMPPGVPDDFLAIIAGIAKERGIKMIVDTSGPALKKALDTGLFLLKPNLSELNSLVGKEFLELDEIDDAARKVLDSSGSEAVIASMGPRGAMVVTKEIAQRIIAPEVRNKSTVGAGDSMVAGMVYKLDQGASILEAAKFGVACGSAATMNEGTQLFRKSDAEKLYEWINRNS